MFPAYPWSREGLRGERYFLAGVLLGDRPLRRRGRFPEFGAKERLMGVRYKSKVPVPWWDRPREGTGSFGTSVE